MSIIEHLLVALTIGVATIIGGAVALALELRRRGLRWTWAALGLPVGLVLWHLNGLLGAVSMIVSMLGGALGASWHHSDLARGADYAQAAHTRLGIFGALRRGIELRRQRREGWVSGGWLRLGRRRARDARLDAPSAMTLGATRSSSARPAPGRPSARPGSPAA
jgi:hypothetical protein